MRNEVNRAHKAKTTLRYLLSLIKRECCHVRYYVPTAVQSPDKRYSLREHLYADAYSIDEHNECIDDEIGYNATAGRSDGSERSRGQSHFQQRAEAHEDGGR